MQRLNYLISEAAVQLMSVLIHELQSLEFFLDWSSIVSLSHFAMSIISY